MGRTRVSISASDSRLRATLESSCPDYELVGEGEQLDSPLPRIAIVARSNAEAESSAPSLLARIVLVDGHEARFSRRRGDVVIEREQFLRRPDDFLSICRELCEAEEARRLLQEELEFLEDIQELTTLADSERVSERITTTVLELLKLPFGTLLLHDPQVERYVVSYSNDPEHRDTGEFVPGVPARLLQRALTSKGPYAMTPPSETQTGLVVMPIEIQEDVIGVLKMTLRSADAYDERLAERAGHYISMVTSVLGNIYQLTRSKDLAMRDDLTKAFNRRFFESYLDEEIERARRYGSVLSVIFLDLDDLKLVNNLYGHLVGSRTLQEVAKKILAAVRAIDKVVRFGGDEFCIILPQTDQAQAKAVAVRVQRAIAGNVFSIEPGIEVTITASFGIATYPQHAVTKDELIRQADAAMYDVKSTTKNDIGVANGATARSRASAVSRVEQGET
ncbi:MAG TPA: diguanylate cyclase [Thermoanaerobaculia bacterium]|nr:diguanylate cyclase [Thermoanaerobaculia bacterium]